MNFDKKEIQILIDIELSQAEKRFGKEFKSALIKIMSLEKLLNPQPEQEKQSRLIPLPLWENYHDYPTLAGMRMKVFNEETNGFKDFGVVHREGKRVFIDEDAWFRWRKRNENT